MFIEIGVMIGGSKMTLSRIGISIRFWKFLILIFGIASCVTTDANDFSQEEIITNIFRAYCLAETGSMEDCTELKDPDFIQYCHSRLKSNSKGCTDITDGSLQKTCKAIILKRVGECGGDGSERIFCEMRIKPDIAKCRDLKKDDDYNFCAALATGAVSNCRQISLDPLSAFCIALVTRDSKYCP